MICFELELNSRNSQVVGIAGILGGTGISGVGYGRHRVGVTRVDSDKEVCLSWKFDISSQLAQKYIHREELLVWYNQVQIT
jgi:hypothetical protein